MRLPRRVVRQSCFWGSILLIVASLALSYSSIRALTAHADWVAHSEAVLDELDELLLLLTDAESGARGYLVTGNDVYLAPYSAALLTAPSVVARIRHLTVDNLHQQSRIDTLGTLVERRLATLTTLVAARRDGLPTSQADPAMLALSKALMGEVRSVIRVMTGEEQELHRVRHRQVQHQAWLTIIFVLIGAIAGITAIATAFLLMNREVALRRRTETQMQDLNTSLEARVRERTAAIERNEQFVNAVLDNIQDGIAACDAEGRLTLFNAATRRLLGESEQPLPPGDWVAHYDLFAADGRTLLPMEKIPLYRALHGERIRNAEIVIAPKSGPSHVLLVSGQPMIDPAGNNLGAVVSLHDITERKAMERQLHEAQKMEAVGQLTGGLAHDFNNILAIVIGNLDLLEAHVEANAEAQELAQSALAAALRGAELTRQLLAFARKQPLAPQTIDLNKLAAGMTALLRRTLGEKIEISMALADDLRPAEADPAQVESALVNLAINARDAMPDGGRLTIETANRVLDSRYAAENTEVNPGNYVMLAVTDTGTGIPPDVLARVFEPFFTTKGPGRGTGLGLSMVYGFAKQSEGHLKIYSEVGHGTTVRLYLPQATTADARASQEAVADGEQRGQGEAILVVEDNAEVRRTAVQQLRGLGYRVLEAENGPAGLAILAETPDIDLLFTDIVMPGGMTGLELARRAREHRPDLKLLYTSGFTEAAVQNGQERPAASRLLSKPYRKQDLARKVHAALRSDGGEEE